MKIELEAGKIHKSGAQELSERDQERLKISYCLRRIPAEKLRCLLPPAESPRLGDVALCSIERVGKNSRIELTTGRAASLHKGDLVAVAFANRYATKQFEGYVGLDGQNCDLMSMGGVCGLVKSKHGRLPEPTKMKVLGYLGDGEGRRLSTLDYRSPIGGDARPLGRPEVTVVCGTAMDAGKTHTAMSLVLGSVRAGHRTAAIKLTGTATGKDTWRFADAGACVALDFIDGGYPATYLLETPELLSLHDELLARAREAGAEKVVIELADGIFQRETAALLERPDFRATVDHWVLAGGGSLSVESALRQLRLWDIEPSAVSGLVSLSPLAMEEVVRLTGVECLTADALQAGRLSIRPPGQPYSERRSTGQLLATGASS